MNRVKIVATIGPRTADADAIRQLRAAGMDVARLNGSHADPDWHARAISLLREVVPDVPILRRARRVLIRTPRGDALISSSRRRTLMTERGQSSFAKIATRRRRCTSDGLPAMPC